MCWVADEKTNGKGFGWAMAKERHIRQIQLGYTLLFSTGHQCKLYVLEIKERAKYDATTRTIKYC